MITAIRSADFQWHGDGAAATVADVRAAARHSDGHDPLDEATELHLKHRGLDGVRLSTAGTHGFSLLLNGELSLAVHPDRRGEGIGAALAADASNSTDAAQAPLGAWSHGDHPAARKLADRHGFSPSRELWVMRRTLHTEGSGGSERAELPELPESSGLPGLSGSPGHPSVQVRGYRTEDAEELLRVNAAAFADHPEQGAMDAANLAERMAEPWFDPAGLLVAVEDGGRLLGFHWTKRHDAHVGEVYVVGIDPAAQGRGLGRLLTLAGLHHLADGDTRQVLLYVEADNLAARAVYAGLGFTHAADDTHVHYTRN